jgi:hypothetical protein
LQLLLKEEADLSEEEKHVRSLIDQHGFPKTIGEHLIAADEQSLQLIHNKLEREISKKRMEISAAEHA